MGLLGFGCSVFLLASGRAPPHPLQTRDCGFPSLTLAPSAPSKHLPIIRHWTTLNQSPDASSENCNHGDSGKSSDDKSSSPEPLESEPPASNCNKRMSRLAMAAEDWLEAADNAEDELLQYWGRFESSRQELVSSEAVDRSPPTNGNQDNAASLTNQDDGVVSTEERLDRYLSSRGINKKQEQQHIVTINKARRHATRDSATAAEAVSILQAVQPLCQPNTRLGGQTLLELAIALWQDDKSEQALNICETLQGNPHIQLQLRDFIRDGPPSRQGDVGAKFRMMWNETW